MKKVLGLIILVILVAIWANREKSGDRNQTVSVWPLAAASWTGLRLILRIDVFDVIRFTAPSRALPSSARSVVGCTDFRDAQEALRRRTLNGEQDAITFASQIGSDERRDRACRVYSSPREPWQIVDKRHEQDAWWYCIEVKGSFDVRSKEEREKDEREKGPPKPLPCFWVHTSAYMTLVEKTSRTKR